jgi:hypothetical protein
MPGTRPGARWRCTRTRKCKEDFVPLPSHLESVSGAQDLYDWFGYWPSFHDAEILTFRLKLGEPAVLEIHTWEMTKQIDAAGFFVQAKHVVVEFVLHDLICLNLHGDPWDHSVILELAITKSDTHSTWISPRPMGFQEPFRPNTYPCASGRGNPLYSKMVTTVTT